MRRFQSPAEIPLQTCYNLTVGIRAEFIQISTLPPLECNGRVRISVRTESARGALIGELYTQVIPLPVRAPCKESREDTGVVPGGMDERASLHEEEPWNIVRVFAGDGSCSTSGAL